MELQSRQVRIVLGRSQRPSATDVHDTPEPAQPCRTGHHRANAGLSRDQGSRHRCVVEFSCEAEHQAVFAAPSGRARRHMARVPVRRRTGAGIPQVHRVFSLSGRVPRAARAPDVRSVRGPSPSGLRSRSRDASARHAGPREGTQERARRRLLQHHEMLHEGVPRVYYDHRQRHHPAEGAGHRSSVRPCCEASADVSYVSVRL